MENETSPMNLDVVVTAITHFVVSEESMDNGGSAPSLTS